jgi:uncharacterized protein
MLDFFARFMPASPHELGRNRFIARFHPWLSHPGLWRMRRQSVAVGAAVGVFFAFMVPVGQIPMSVLAAILLRANVPVACLATLVNTPFTFGPVYYGAYHLGVLLLGGPSPETHLFAEELLGEASGPGRLMGWVNDLGPALVVGTAVLSIAGSLLAYLSVVTGWRLVVATRWRRRKSARD